MEFEHIVFSEHAVMRMFDRAIELRDVRDVLQAGRVIAQYPDDKPLPSGLMLGFVEDRPLHVVTSFDEDSRTCYVITVYEPKPDLWNDTFEKRKRK
jgi:hypothetical protein